jgi:hypothetical protein
VASDPHSGRGNFEAGEPYIALTPSVPCVEGLSGAQPCGIELEEAIQHDAAGY